jgi:DNA polymerase delta subunit 3
MLFDFHQKQNAKKPGSVHATYLITGTRTPPKPQHHANADTQDGQDAVMQSSPPIPNRSAPQAPEDDAEPTPVRSVLLVKEEHLSQAKATFEKITGIHVYSLAARGLSDLNSLTECNRKIAVECASEDPLVAWKQYGTIQNPNVKRRTQKRPPPPPATLNTKEAPAKAKPAPALEKQATKASNEPEPTSAKATPVPEKNTDATKKKTATKPVTLKREASSIFKSFAKGANKAKKPTSTESSAAPSPAPVPAEDESMGGMSDDDIDSPAVDEEIEVDAGTGRSKKDREADLKAMMDADDEEMEDVADGVSDNALDAPKDDENEASQESTKEEPKETMTVENGRRRGRRRVMKKKTVKDDEGYLGESVEFLIHMYDMILTSRSDTRRSSMGVLFRRRARPEES